MVRPRQASATVLANKAAKFVVVDLNKLWGTLTIRLNQFWGGKIIKAKRVESEMVDALWVLILKRAYLVNSIA